MCTLTFYPKKNGTTVLTFNRDEQPSRSSVEVICDKNKGFLYPKDKLHNGTWLMVDAARKRVVCLLNGAFKLHERQLPYRKSRGLMVLDTMAYDDITSFFFSYNFVGIEPFSMVTWQQNELFCCRWDGSKRHVERYNTHETHLWSSATLYDKPTQKKREKWFEDWQNELAHEDATIEDLWQFHQTGGSFDPENGLRMSRPWGVKTVSTAQIIISQQDINFQYYELENNAIIHQNLDFEPEYAFETTSDPQTTRHLSMASHE